MLNHKGNQALSGLFVHCVKEIQRACLEPLEVFYKKRCFENFTVFIGKHLCWSLFLIKLQAFQAGNFIKKRLQHSCFLVNIPKFSITPIMKSICEQLLLHLKWSSFGRTVHAFNSFYLFSQNMLNHNV